MAATLSANQFLGILFMGFNVHEGAVKAASSRQTSRILTPPT
jgi:hypothetical protein